MQKIAHFEKYFYELRSKVPNNCRIVTMLALAIALSVTVTEGTIPSVRVMSGFITFAILLLLGATTQP